MIKTAISAIALAIVLGASAAQAASIINRDTAAHKIVVVEGDERKEVTVEASQEVSDLCSQSCNVYVGSDPDPYDLASSDKVEIQDGQLQYQLEEGESKQPQ